MTSRQPGALPPGTTGHYWLRLLPLALLIILGLAGLRGAVATPRWDGPLHRDAVAVGAGLLALGAGAGMLPEAGPGAGSALLRRVAAGALIAAGGRVLPYVARHPGTPDNPRAPSSRHPQRPAQGL